MSELLALGVSHKTAPVALRERVAMSDDQAEHFVAGLPVHECVVISTCNRTELYMVVSDPVEAESAVLSALAQRAGIRPTQLADVMYAPRNCDAARHLFRVAAGLDSMIVGEHEVQGQVRRALEATKTGGPMTSKLFNAALHTGRRVRNETAIGEAHVNISSVAVELAKECLGDLSGRNVLVIGAGETSELTARALAAAGVTTIFIANRHADRAIALAERFGGRVSDLEGMPKQLELADIVLASTASPEPILGQEELELVMRARGGRPLLLIDLAVPRDIDSACADLEGVSLHDIDDLQAVVARNLWSRAQDVPQAEEIVEHEIQHFAQWLGQLDVLPAIATLREHASEIVAGVLRENEGRWEDERDAERAEAVARAVMNRLLHDPTLRLKELDPDRSHGAVKLLRELFGLGAGDETPAESPVKATPRVSALRIGTRASKLALTQAGQVAAAVGDAELVQLTTSGDRDGARGDKSRWVDEIERALLEERIDVAVHSAKDVPGELARGTEIAGCPVRVDARDALCGAESLDSLSEGARIGTSSLRRAAQLLALRPDLQIVELRGNVDTRLRRLADGDYDAIVLARAGLERLGLDVGTPLPELVPAPGQGTLALQARAGDARVAEAIAPLRDGVAERELLAERAVVRRLEAGCETPLGVHATMHDGHIHLRAFVGRSDGSAWLRDELSGADPIALGQVVGERLLAAGAQELLA